MKIGIAGCGKVAVLHAKAISQISNASLAGVWSRTPKTAIEFANRFETKSYASISELVSKGDAQIIIICTPHPFHKAAALEAASIGAHVLVEKPISSTYEDAMEIVDGCHKSKIKLGVISQRRWYEPVIRMKNAIDTGKIGQPILATVSMLGWRDKAYYDADEWRGTWKMEGGGVLVNQSPHQLDLMLWMMGEIEEVYGHWSNFNHPEIEVDDTALAVVKFKNGGIGNIIVSNSQKPGIHGNLHVHGTEATVGVQTEGGAMFIAGSTGIEEAPFNDLWTISSDQKLLSKWKQDDHHAFFLEDPTIKYMRDQIQEFIAAVQEDRDPAVTGTDGLKVVELFTAIYRSTRDGGPIKFPLTDESERNDMDGRLTSPKKL